ncbi:MAG TPA: lipid-A-disaccharide synthase [Niabella sp.]
MKTAPRYYIIAGEASGDLHGGNLVAALKVIQPGCEIRGWGGDKMAAAGMEVVKHYKDLAFMGFLEVMMNLKTILRNLRSCKEDILAFRPDVLILIDYPGFNLRIAKWARQQNIKIAFYISPQVWAWKEGRVKMMKRCIDKMLVILPFEQEYYKNKWDWEVDYVGHPLIEEIDRKKKAGTDLIIRDAAGRPVSKPVIALLPGSRKQEIEKKLPVMLAVSKNFPDYQFVVAQAPAVEDAFYKQFTNPYPNISIVQNRTYDVLLQATAALVTSGTATLETALFGVPEVVCYKGSEISYQIAKRVISIQYISLVNLIMNREIVKELIQGEMNEKNITAELKALLFNEPRKQQLKDDYEQLYQVLAAKGDASRSAATIITHLAMEQ